MKKTVLKLGVLSLFVMFLASCSSQMERDATNMAERTIELEQMQERMKDRSNLRGKPITRQEYNQFSQEYLDYSNEMLEKYSETPEQQKEFSDLVEKKTKELKNEN